MIHLIGSQPGRLFAILSLLRITIGGHNPGEYLSFFVAVSNFFLHVPFPCAASVLLVEVSVAFFWFCGFLLLAYMAPGINGCKRVHRGGRHLSIIICLRFSDSFAHKQ